MKKTIIFIILVLILFGAFGGVSFYRTFVTNNESDISINNKTEDGAIIAIPIDDVKGITPGEAEKLCVLVFGKEDKETGFLFSFGVAGAVERNNKQYYVIRTSWLVNNSHLSYIGDYFVSADGKQIYSGIAKPWEEYSMDSLVWPE